MSRRDGIRASDTDRETVAERLRRAAHEGRLNTDELESRLAAVFRARTYGELDGVTADLPVPRLAVAARGEAAPRRRGVPRSPVVIGAVAVTAVVAAALIVALLVLIATGWALWVLVAWAFAGHRRLPPPPRPYVVATRTRRRLAGGRHGVL